MGAKGRGGGCERGRLSGRAESSTRVSDGPSTEPSRGIERNGGNKGTRERERERGVEQTVCSLDRIIAGGSGAHLASPRLAANHLDLTFPPTSLPILHLSFVYRSWCSVLSDSDTFLSHPLLFLLFSFLLLPRSSFNRGSR